MVKYKVKGGDSMEKQDKKGANNIRTIGYRLRALREDTFNTQNDVAKACGITAAAYASWEQGRSVPAIDKLPILASFYGVSTDYILGVAPSQVLDRMSARLGTLSPKNQQLVQLLIDTLSDGEKGRLTKK